MVSSLNDLLPELSGSNPSRLVIVIEIEQVIDPWPYGYPLRFVGRAASVPDSAGLNLTSLAWRRYRLKQFQALLVPSWG